MPANPFSDSLSVTVTGDSADARRALGGLQSSILSTRKLALGLGGVLAGALAAKGLGSAISAAGDFNSKMNESLAIMGDVSESMREDMARAARDVAKTTTFSAEQAAESYFFLASAGLGATESIEAMPEVARFAQAGMFDMAQATDLLTDSASALGLEVDDYNELADELVKANTLANASVEQFAESLKSRAAAEMRNANVAIEEGISVLAAFADQGIKGQRAGQVFQRTLLTLQEASRENSDALRELGIRIFDADGEMRNLATITEELTDATADMSTEERNAALESLGFTRRTREGIVALLGKSEQLREYESELSKAGGTAKEVADKQLQSFNSRVKLLSSNLNDLKITIGNELLPAVNDFVGGLNKLLSGSEDLADVLGPDMADDITGIAEAAKNLVGPAEDNADEIVRLSDNLFTLGREAIPLVEPALRDIKLILEATAGALDTVNDAIERSMELWGKLPKPLQEALLLSAKQSGRLASPTEFVTGGASEFVSGAQTIQKAANGPIVGAGASESNPPTEINVTVEGDTGVVESVSAEVVNAELQSREDRFVRVGSRPSGL